MQGSMEYAATTPRLWLERLGDKHAEDYYAIVTAPESLEWSVSKPLQNVAEARTAIETMTAHLDADKFAVLLRPKPTETRDKEKMIGLIGTKAVPELMYIIHPDFANKGYMTEALDAFIGPKGFFWDLSNRKDISVLKCQVDPGNVASMRLVEKIGAKEVEGGRREKAYPLYRDRDSAGKISRERFRDLVVWVVERPGCAV